MDGELLSNLEALPTELLAYVISFLTNVRDVGKLRYVSSRLRSVCDTSWVWREFIWPQFDIREEHCVRSLLKSCGKYIKRVSFPDHVIRPSKLTTMLRCSRRT